MPGSIDALSTLSHALAHGPGRLEADRHQALHQEYYDRHGWLCAPPQPTRLGLARCLRVLPSITWAGLGAHDDCAAKPGRRARVVSARARRPPPLKRAVLNLDLMDTSYNASGRCRAVRMRERK